MIYEYIFLEMVILKFDIKNEQFRQEIIYLNLTKYSCTVLSNKAQLNSNNKIKNEIGIIKNQVDKNYNVLPRNVPTGDFNEYVKINKLERLPRALRYTMDGYLLYLFMNEITVSNTYRTSVLNLLDVSSSEFYLKIVVKVYLTTPRCEFLDYKWNERLTELCQERRELDYTMSWLSTLGGAFSALGDHYTNCAKIAGKISVHQFKLALRIGDPLTVARCKLYMSLSLVQQEKFKLAKFLILEQYNLAKNNQVIDYRLINMCKGIWAKLRYERRIYKQGKLIHKTTNERLKIKSS